MYQGLEQEPKTTDKAQDTVAYVPFLAGDISLFFEDIGIPLIPQILCEFCAKHGTKDCPFHGAVPSTTCGDDAFAFKAQNVEDANELIQSAISSRKPISV